MTITPLKTTKNQLNNYESNTKMNTDIQTLIVSHMGLADRIAVSKYRKTPCVNVDEMKSAAYYGLVDAANRYDSQRCDSFEAYACIRISGAICDYLRELSWGSRNNRRTVESYTIEELFNEEEVSDEFFDNVTNSLPYNYKKVLRLRYIEGWQLQDISDEFGVTRGRISQLLKKARNLVRYFWLGKESELWSEVA